MYYGNYDESGKYLGYYIPELHCKLVPIFNTEPIEETQEEVIEQENAIEQELINQEPKIIQKTITHAPGTVQVGEEWDLSTIPTPYIELTETEWQEALTGEYKVIDGKHTYSPPPGATAEEIAESQLASIDAEYQPQFQSLQLAWGAASMDGKEDLAAGIQRDYTDLKSEYQTKREGVISGNS